MGMLLHRRNVEKALKKEEKANDKRTENRKVKSATPTRRSK